MDKFLKIVENNLPAVQMEFDSYQKKYFPARSPEFFCLELNGEAGELANFEKKLWKGKHVDFKSLEDEAADVFIALMNYCNARKIDLGSSVAKKLDWIDKKMKSLKENGEEY